MVAAVWEDLLKVGRGLPVVIIIVVAAFFFVPGAGKLYANTADQLGISNPSIGEFSATLANDGFLVNYRVLGGLQKLEKVETTWHYKKLSNDAEGMQMPANPDNAETLLSIKSGAGSILKEQETHGEVKGEKIIVPGGVNAGIYRFTLELFGQGGNLLDDKDIIIALSEPYVSGLRADAYGNSKSVELRWKIPDGTAPARSYDVKMKYSAYPPDKSPIGSSDFTNFFSDKKITFSKETKLSAAPTETFLRYPQSGSLPSGEMGGYWFILSVKNNDGKETFRSESYTGIYDNNFVETYRDLKEVKDACDADCDVVGKKGEALGSDKLGWSKMPGSAKTYTEFIFEKDEASFKVSCSLLPKEKGQKKISGCTESEVDKLYSGVVKERVSLEPNSVRLGKTADDLLKFECASETWMSNYAKLKDTVLKVCTAKAKLKEKLYTLGWAYAG